MEKSIETLRSEVAAAEAEVIRLAEAAGRASLESYGIYHSALARARDTALRARVALRVALR